MVELPTLGLTYYPYYPYHSNPYYPYYPHYPSAGSGGHYLLFYKGIKYLYIWKVLDNLIS